MSGVWHQQIITNQILLETHLHNIFPHHNILTNTRKEAAIKNPNSGGYLEVDVWLPDIDLCFEFQDDYHYKSVWYSQIPLSVIQLKDNIKRSKMLEKRQTLVNVPYWWDGSSTSLQETIRFHRPELLLQKANCLIPSNPPWVSLESQKLMLTSFPDDNTVMDLVENSLWWVGEKWDGIRCYWDSAENQLYSRHNLQMDLHPGLSDSFGRSLLDGELWSGRGLFHESQNFAVSSWERLNSSFLRLVCFDEASPHLQLEPFETRYSTVLSQVSEENPAVILAPRFMCTNETTLLSTLQGVMGGGGEGLILRKPQSLYIFGRSKLLIKLKASHGDQEALVVKVNDDGSLLLQLPSGFTFTVPKSDCMFSGQAEKGDIVTFSFDFAKRVQYTSVKDLVYSVPSNPIIHCIRSDLSWADVVINSSLPLVRWFGNETHQYFKSSAKNFWDTMFQHEQFKESIQAEKSSHNEGSTKVQSWKSVSKRRKYFDKFAAYKRKDPLNPEFWYRVTSQDLRQYNDAYSHISRYYGRRLSSALMQLYPDIGLQKSRFKAKPKQLWKLKRDRRAFLDTFATSKGMDSLNPLFWYTTTPQELVSYDKAFRTIAKYHGRKFSTTVMQLYPNIGLKKSSFKVKKESWILESERKKYFDDFAASKGMDSLNAGFWYDVSPQDLLSYHNGYSSISKYYGRKLSTALVQLYPNIGLQKSLFKVQSWKSETDRRDYFDNFASHTGMDSLNPQFWYSVTTQDLTQFHNGFYPIIKYHGGKLSTTLTQLYPDIGLQTSYFKVKNRASAIT